MCHYTNCKKAHSKGLPLHVGIVILLSAPIMNPVVLLSTVYAFQKNDYIVYARFGVTILVALFIGLIVYYRYRERNVLKDVEVSVQKTKKSWKDVMNHTVDEFLILVSIY